MPRTVDRLVAIAAELRRRRVFHAAGLYLVAAWVVIEVTATVFPLLLLPEWTSRAVVVLAILGLPVAVAVSWAFDLTPDGLRRTGPGEASAPGSGPTLAGILLVVLTVLATAAAGWGARNMLFVPRQESAPAPALDPARVAVLYFDDFSRDGRLGYLADGLTEALINELAQLEPLAVVSRNGVKPYRDLAIPVDSLARILGAGMLVEGSVEGGGDRLIATVQLIDGRTGVHLLSRRLERDGGDVLALRDELVTEAGRLLGQAMGRELELGREARGTDDADAWERVQLARSRMNDADTLRWSRGDLDAAQRALASADTLLRDAARRDPRWPEPLIMQAEIRLGRARWGEAVSQSADEAEIRRGLAYADSALALEPGNPEAWALRGSLRHQLSWVEGDSADALLRLAEDDYRGAIEADPSQVEAWIGLADLLRARGDFAEASVAAERALDADPFLIHAEKHLLFTLGHVWLELEQFERARRWADEGRRRYPAEPAFAAQRLVIAAGWAGEEPDVDTAWSLVRAVEAGYGLRHWPHGRLQAAATLARTGQADSARAVVAAVREDGDPEPWLDYYEANVRLQLGEERRALDLLEHFLQQLPHRRSYIAGDWWWRPLQDTPRFRALVADP